MNLEEKRLIAAKNPELYLLAKNFFRVYKNQILRDKKNKHLRGNLCITTKEESRHSSVLNNQLLSVDNHISIENNRED